MSQPYEHLRDVDGVGHGLTSRWGVTFGQSDELITTSPLELTRADGARRSWEPSIVVLSGGDGDAPSHIVSGAILPSDMLQHLLPSFSLRTVVCKVCFGDAFGELP